MQPITNFFNRFFTNNSEQEVINYEKMLIQNEAKIGGQLFGPVTAGSERHFFCLDEYSWVWSESWKDEDGHNQTLTTRYELRGNNVMKVQNGTYYQLSSDEKRHLKRAIELYYQQVVQSMYSRYVGQAAA